MADRKEQDTDWANKQEVIMTLPHYMQHRIKNAGVKGITNAVDIELFTLKKPMSADYLLVDTPLKIEARRRTCLVGDPGSGKSTLFKAIAQKEIKGFPQHLNVWHCQEIEHGPHATSVIETVVSSHSLLSSLWHAESALKAELSSSPPPSSERKVLLQANLSFVDQLLSPLHADTAYERAAKMLRVLGFDEEGQKKSTNDLSGGLRMRVALCAAFFVEADLLLLDEPTNHLDFPSVLWLENRLRAYSGSFLLIAHDRELLENTVTSVIHIEDQKLISYNSDFKTFEKTLAKAWAKRAKEVDRFLMLNRNVDFSSPIAKEKAEKEAWLEAYQRKQVMLQGKFTFPLPRVLELPDNPEPAPEGEVSLVNVKDVTFSYNIDVEDPFYIFETPININITTATRMGVMGPNGAGKSTFLKLITDRLQPISGSIIRHPTAEVAYFAQHHIMDLDITKTPIEYMMETFPGEKSGNLRGHLGKVGLVGLQVETRMQSLSHGQRSCILFAKITYKCPDMLIMDEPTNFLDMESVDSLIAATRKFKGALLLVSHNRGFLDGCVNTYLSIVPGRFELFDNLKNCERATYQFIEEMEGGGGLKAGANSMTNTLTKVKEIEKPNNVIAISVAKPTPPPKEEKKEEEKVEEKPKVVKPQLVCDESMIGSECLAVYKADGKEYPAIIKRVFPNSGEVTVEYIGYNENAILKMACVRFGVKAAPKGRQNGKANGKPGGNKPQNGKAAGKGGNKAQNGLVIQQNGKGGHHGPRSGGR